MKLSPNKTSSIKAHPTTAQAVPNITIKGVQLTFIMFMSLLMCLTKFYSRRLHLQSQNQETPP